jgi:hypothetical protein
LKDQNERAPERLSMQYLLLPVVHRLPDVHSLPNRHPFAAIDDGAMITPALRIADAASAGTATREAS